jgi:hypothetical protein
VLSESWERENIVWSLVGFEMKLMGDPVDISAAKGGSGVEITLVLTAHASSTPSS